MTGGLRLAAHKAESTEQAIRRDFVPDVLYVSTRQHQGPASAACVAVGDRILRGQTLARAESVAAADVHAPTSGLIVAIEKRPVPLYSAVTSETCIVIEPDGLDLAAEPVGPVPLAPDRAERIAQLTAAGIVGLGGAVYPTAAKLGSDPEFRFELLIINGAECEPYISCDDVLMRESPEEILRGAEILREVIGASECIIAIERDKPDAIEAITTAAEALGAEGLSIAELPSVYPAGGERQLVEVLTGAEVPSSSYPGEFGFLCQNVGTAYSVCRFFEQGEPLTRRIVTVTGSAVAEPRNVDAMIGTPIAELIAACGGYRADAVRLIHGGSMMGFALASDSLPITKATNCIVAAEGTEIRRDMREWPCIRCGECSIACPARLQPQDLLIAARETDMAGLQALALDECIECGCCDVVCPSHIALTDLFRRTKPRLGEHRRLQAQSRDAQERFIAREHRRDELHRQEALRREALKLALNEKTARSKAIGEAVQRARQKGKPGQ